MKAAHRNKLLAVLKNWKQTLQDGKDYGTFNNRTDKDGEFQDYQASQYYWEDEIGNLKSFMESRLYPNWKDKKGGIEATKRIWKDTKPLTDKEIKELKINGYFIKDNQRIFVEESTRPAEQLKKNPDWEKFSYTTWSQPLTGKVYIYTQANNYNDHPLLNPDNWAIEELTKLNWYKLAELFIYWK